MVRSKGGFRPHLLAAAAMSALGLGAAPAAHAVDDDQWYIGVLVHFEAKATPALVIGYRAADVDPDGDANGWDISLHADADGLRSLKLKGFEGERCTQGELGVGFDFRRSTALFNAGVQGNYINGGLDYSLGAGFSPYLGLSTIGCYDKPPAEVIDDGGGYGNEPS